MATIHATLECGREVHHGGCTCAKDAEIAALKAAQDGIHAVGYREGVLAERQHNLKATADGDAEIAALKAEVESKNATIEATRRHVDRLRRALAAGPAALRKVTDDYDGAAEIVEAAQAAALKEGT